MLWKSCPVASERRWRGALVLAHNRQELLDQALAAIQPQVDSVMVVDNASDPRMVVPEGVGTMYVPDQPPNLSRFWNMGLDFFVAWFSGRPHDVAVLCDDAVAPPGWFTAVTQAMRDTGAVVGCSNPWGTLHEPRVKTAPDRDVVGRMPGWAWIKDGGSPIRADERLMYWYGDTSIDFNARRSGGMVMIGGYAVANLRPDHFLAIKPELAVQAAKDAATYASIEGSVPWP